MNPLSDVSNVEAELELLCNNYNIPKEDARLYARIDDFNYYPIETHLDNNGRFVVEDFPEAIGNDLVVGTKRQFIHERINMTANNFKIELSTKFKTAWNPDNFIVFQNGLLLNSVLWKVYCPTFYTEYITKVIYNRNVFKKNDYIDIFYIEADDRFKNIRFNHDVYIKYVKFICETKNQLVVQIPYPYASYPRQTEMFFIFNNQTKRFLFRDEDYYTDETGHYVIMRHNDILVRPSYDIITFVFPYCQSDYEDEESRTKVGEETGTIFTISSYQWIPDYPKQIFSPNPVIEFKPKFDKYVLDSDNFLIFHNNVYLHPSRYQLVDNNHIRLLDPADIARTEFEKFTMLIYEETDPRAKAYRSFEFDVYSVTLTSDGQSVINVPPMDPENTGFLVFYGSLMFDVSNKFEWDYSNNTITVNPDCLDEMIAGRELVFVFYTNDPAVKKKKKTFELIKIKFESDEDGYVEMVNESGYDIYFNKKNCILFMNGTYLDPDRYEIIDGYKLVFVNPLDQLRMHKAFTGCFLVAHILEPDLPIDLLDDIRDGYPNKLLWFDEIDQKPIIELVDVT